MEEHINLLFYSIDTNTQNKHLDHFLERGCSGLLRGNSASVSKDSAIELFFSELLKVLENAQYKNNNKSKLLFAQKDLLNKQLEESFLDVIGEEDSSLVSISYIELNSDECVELLKKLEKGTFESTILINCNFVEYQKNILTVENRQVNPKIEVMRICGYVYTTLYKNHNRVDFLRNWELEKFQLYNGWGTNSFCGLIREVLYKVGVAPKYGA